MANENTRRTIRRWRFIAAFLSIVCIALVITLIVIYPRDGPATGKISPCSGAPATGTIDISDTDTPSVFQDLTANEIKGLMDYIYSDEYFSLSKSDNYTVDKSFMSAIDLYLPNKEETLAYLDGPGNVPQPKRAAKVTLYRGDKIPPVVEEYIISPLPKPNHHEILRKVPFNFRPMNGPEYGGMMYTVVEECSEKIPDVLFDSFGGYLKDCDNKCLGFQLCVGMGQVVTKDPNVRKFWFWLSQFSEYFVLHPVDFSVLVTSDGYNHSIGKVWYNMQLFDSLDRFAESYRNDGNLTKLKVPFPDDSDNLFSKMHQRGDLFPEYPQQSPIFVEPDGKRYTITRQEIRYMNWKFHYRMSTLHSPQLYDVRYKNERIVYELGLQEVVVFYSGNKPYHMFSNFFDSVAMLGRQSRGLVPGIDCPNHATFLDMLVVYESATDPALINNALCVFELNTGEPLRRHHSYYRSYGQFYEGAPNNVLVFRTIVTVTNYDYIVDYVFYQNGVLKVSVTASGYIIPEFITPGSDEKYGFKLQDHISGIIHHHTIHFKVDLDIKGANNSYETIEVKHDAVPNRFSPNPTAKWDQEKIERSLHSSERDAAYKFDFNAPKYHIFYNKLEKDKNGNPKSYRILSKGMSKSVLPEGTGNEPSAAWMRYQMAVTKHKDSESESSTQYASFDSVNPTVNFEKFIEDNENIEDKDLVAWVTIGTHHIPHTEDLPVTHTPGNDMSFYLLPFNYFPEDPGMASRDSIRIERSDSSSNTNAPLNIKQNRKSTNIQCLPPKNDYMERIQREPTILFNP